MKKKFVSLLLCAAMAAVLICGCGSSTSGTTSSSSAKSTQTSSAAASSSKNSQLSSATLNVFIAASLSNVMEDLAKSYNAAQPNVKIQYNADSSGTLQKQIEEGAECDMFFSAATDKMDTLDTDGYMVANSRTDLLENKVVLIKAKGSSTKVTGFENITDAANLALAGEDVPVGKYAREIFDSLGITDSVMSMEINECANVTAVLTAVAEGSNEVGIVYATDAASMSDKVEVIAEAPAGSMKTAVYPVALIKNDKQDDAAKAAAEDFLKYITSSDAAATFEKYGFTIHK